MAAPIRILLVEDEPLYALLLLEFVRRLRYMPVGPAATAGQASTCCYLAWVSLRQYGRTIGRTIGQTIYQTHLESWSEFLRQQLKKPFAPALLPASAQVLLL